MVICKQIKGKKKKEEILFEMVDILDGTESWCIL
jgi:hypothetical protein